MTDSTAPTCPSCGALVADDADVCDLCGTSIPTEEHSSAEEAQPLASEASASAEATSSTSPEDGGEQQRVYCNACGWENPPNARYCSQCGERLQDMSEAQPAAVPADLPQPDRASETEPSAEETGEAQEAPASGNPEAKQAGMGRQVGMIIGIGVLLVVGLFLVTTWSDARWSRSSAGESSANGSAPNGSAVNGSEGASSGTPALQGRSSAALSARAAPETDLATLVEELGSGQEEMPDQLVQRIDSLRSVIENSTGAARHAARRELANAYIGGGHLGQAALLQKDVAEATDNPDDWRRTGDLLYSWMETLGNQPESRTVAQHVVEAYQHVLDQQPDNLDVRTDMATAYLQTNNPMRGVKEINRVLEQNPDHFQARFNKGIMLTMIGRAKEAITQFERVKEIVGEDSPYYQQAEQAIQTIRKQLSQQSSGDS